MDANYSLMQPLAKLKGEQNTKRALADVWSHLAHPGQWRHKAVK